MAKASPTLPVQAHRRSTFHPLLCVNLVSLPRVFIEAALGVLALGVSKLYSLPNVKQ